MPELRPRKPAKATPKENPKEKAPLKRKAAGNDDASPAAPKKLKGDAQPKEPKKLKESKKPKESKEPKESKKPKESKELKEPKEPKRSASKKKQEEEKPAQDDDESNASESDTEAQALAKIVDSDAEADDAGPEEEIQTLELPKVSKDVAKASDSENSEPGVVYIGRIPKGFYEHQMREYFSQFGQVNKIRMSRNKATGQSKHFAFIEFAELGVAEIVAKTMDNYLLSGHILKVKMVPKSQIHEKLWVGANRRFKKVPWNKMAGNRLKKPLPESTWTEKISKEETKRSGRAKKLLAIGYEFEAPKLKGVHGENDTAALEDAKDDAPKAIEAAPQTDDAATSKPARAAKKATKAKGDKSPAAKTGKAAKKGKKTA
ncbi:RNA-binding domain-containing protein [Xylaria intraflava]|nr:RNA-binding domain-containing protein [Xylaria intraflava]